jgi:glycosyltransferase involved in cell wall biosynthesis
MTTVGSDDETNPGARRRIGVYIPSAEGGGAERAMIRLAGGLAGRGHEVDLVLGCARGPYLDEIDPRVRLIDLGRPGFARPLPRLARYLRDEKPDVLIPAMSHANVLALLAALVVRSRVPIIVSEQLSLTAYREQARGWKHRLLRLMMHLLYPRAAAVTAVSRALADELAQRLGLPPGQVHYVPNPIVSDELAARAEAAPAHPWLEGDVPVVLAVGRLAPEKEIATLIRAFAAMARPARLIALGEGPERPQLEALAAELGVAGRVALPGFDANSYAYMRRARLFVLPSRAEGLPSVLIEAMACGTPVVATDCRTGPREILEDGRWGTLVPVGDEAALGRAMDAALARDDHPDVRRRAADYSIAASVDAWLALVNGSGGC